MLDTVSLTTVRPLLPEVAAAIEKGDGLTVLPSGWSFSYTKSSGAQAHAKFTSSRLSGHHEPTGLYVHGVPGELRGWTASLPGVLHGLNGIQLKDDAEIPASFDRVNEILAEVSFPSRMPDTFRRVDVAMNLATDNPEAILRTFNHNSHRWIRREKERYATGNIRLPGSEVVFQAYWKKPPVKTGIRRKKWHTPGVLRLEVQLKSVKKIAEFLDLDPDRPPQQLPKRRDLYEAFRRFMLGFQRRAYRTDKCTLAAVLAVCESQQWRLPSGETMMDWHRTSRGQDAHRKMRGAVASISARSLNVDWAELLPDHSIPAGVDVRADMTTKLIPSVRLMRTWPRFTHDEILARAASRTELDDDLGD